MAIGKLVERTRQTCAKVIRRISNLPRSVRGGKRNNRVSPNPPRVGEPQMVFMNEPFEEQLLRLERRQHIQGNGSIARYISAINSFESNGMDQVNPAFEWGTPRVCSTPLSTRSGRSEGLDNSLNEALEKTGASSKPDEATDGNEGNDGNNASDATAGNLV